MRAFVRAAAVVVAATVVGVPLAAQGQNVSNGFANTGQSTTGGTDNYWFVAVCPLLADGSNCASPSTTTFLPNASVILPGSIPTPPWYPNQSNAQWIGASPTGTLPSSNGQGQTTYRYIFGTAFTSNSNTLSFAYNSDNYFRGWMILPGSGQNFDPNSIWDNSNWNDPTPPGQNGFCRNPDGAFAPPCPALSPEITVNNVATDSPNVMLFKVDGDGQTDGLFVTSTPEPASLALLGTGLFGLVPMVRRRRR